ncbi:MAG: hypothetical protein ACLPN1_04005 [Dissulfurispiraceae bacterium]|jgi:hypothetical protein
MVTAAEQTGLGRLEDFISFAKTGAKISATVELHKQSVSQKVHPGNNEEMHREVDMYLLTSDFTFKIGNDSRKVTKVYLIGASTESVDDSRVQVNIANARLKEDYKRLNSVNIAIEEKFY